MQTTNKQATTNGKHSQIATAVSDVLNNPNAPDGLKDGIYQFLVDSSSGPVEKYYTQPAIIEHILDFHAQQPADGDGDTGPVNAGTTAVADENAPTISNVIALIRDRARDLEQTFADRGEDGDVDDLRQDVDSFMLSLFNRIDKLFPDDVRHRLGYAEHLGDIRANLSRLSGMSRRPIRNERLDGILDALIHESRMLVESQSTFCEYCEHCLREHPDKRDYETTTDDTLTAEEFALAVESLTDESGGLDVLAVILRHIESLAWVSRPNAVKDAVSQIIDGLTDKQRNRSGERKQLLASGREALKRLAKYKAESEGDGEN